MLPSRKPALVPAKVTLSKPTSPSPVEIRQARIAAGLTQTQAAATVHTICRTWQQWEAGDRHMHPAFWELFRIKSSFIVHI